MKNSTFVSLIPGSKASFRRAVRDEKGKIVKVLLFTPDSPLELSPEEVEVVSKDIGRVLCYCEPLGGKEDRYQVDWESTNDHHQAVHGAIIPRQSGRTINVGAGAEKSKVIEAPKAEVTPGPEVDDEELIELGDELMSVLAENFAVFGASSPDDVGPEVIEQFLLGGGKLEDVQGLTPAMAKELAHAQALSRDLSKLTDAGISEDLAVKLSMNIHGGDDYWVLDPDKIREKLAEGANLEKLAHIGRAGANRIKKALKV